MNEGIQKSRAAYGRAAFLRCVLRQVLVRFETAGANLDAGTVDLGRPLQIGLTALFADRVEFGRTGAVRIAAGHERTFSASCACLCHSALYASRGRARCQSHPLERQAIRYKLHETNPFFFVNPRTAP